MTKTDEYEPELVVPENGDPPFYLSNDGFGTMIAWGACHLYSGGCGKSLMACNCKNGPKEPYYITRWRVEAQGGTFKMPKVTSAMRAPQRPLGTEKVQPKSSQFRESRSSGLAVSDFIDADVIARVKAASETAEEDR